MTEALTTTDSTDVPVTEVKIDHKKRLDDWFDNKFLCVYQNTTKVEPARRELHRYQPTSDILETIYDWILADNRQRHQARRAGGFYPDPPNCWTFFHESRWMDKLSPIGERKNVQLVCVCGTEVKNLYPFKGKNYCLKCYEELAHPDFKRKIYDQLCKVGLGKLKEETREQWRTRIRDHGMKVIAKHFGK